MQKYKDMAPDPGGTKADKALAMRYAFGSGADPDRELVEEVCRKLDASGEEDAAAVASYCRWYIADLDGRYADSMKYATDYISSPEAEENIKVQLLDYLDEKKNLLAGMDEWEKSEYLKIKESPESETPVRGKKTAVIGKVIIGIVILAVIAAGLIVGLRACGGGEDSPSGTGNKEEPEYSTEHDEAMSAYKDMLSSGGIEVLDRNFETENCSFAVAYIDDDDIPELLIYDKVDSVHTSGHGALYIYRDGQVELIDSLDMDIDDDMEAGYLKGSGYFTDGYVIEGYAYMLINSVRNATLTMNGHEAEETSFTVSYKIDDPYGSETYYNYYDPISEYGGEPDSDEFHETLDEMTGGAEFVPYDFHKNTPENREKVLR